jgi:hypothetical protein
MSTPFKMKGFSGFGNSPVKYEKEKLEYYKSTKTKPTTGGRKSIKSSDLTKEQMQNIFPR